MYTAVCTVEELGFQVINKFYIELLDLNLWGIMFQPRFPIREKTIKGVIG